MLGIELGFGRLGEDRIQQLLARHRAAEVTYDHVGSTLPGGALGARSRRKEREVVDDFDAAARRLRRWAAQASLGARVHPDSPPGEGDTAVVALAVPGLWMAPPVRIVGVVDEPDRVGFAYGTLPGHPERGEESFVVERRRDGSVWAVVTVEAVPGPPIARLFGPLVQLLSGVALGRYARAIAGR